MQAKKYHGVPVHKPPLCRGRVVDGGDDLVVAEGLDMGSDIALVGLVDDDAPGEPGVCTGVHGGRAGEGGSLGYLRVRRRALMALMVLKRRGPSRWWMERWIARR